MQLTKDDITELDELLERQSDRDFSWPIRRDLVNSMDAIIEIFRYENKLKKEELINNMWLHFAYTVPPFIRCDWKNENLFTVDIDMSSNKIKFSINEDLISKDKISEIKDLKLLDNI